MVDAGADVNSKDKYGQSTLHHAAKCNDVKMIEYLLSKRADVNIVQMNELTPLHLAVQENVDDSHYRSIRMLLKNGANINACTKYGRTPLQMSTFQNNFKTVELLLNYKADVKIKNTQGICPLFNAVCQNHFEIVKLLIDHGSDVNELNKTNGPTLLHQAAAKNDHKSHFRVIETLLKNGANVNAKDKAGKTPLNYLLETGNLEIIKLLLKFGADVNIKDLRNEIPLFEMIRYKKDFEFVKLLIDYGSDVNFISTRSESTPIHLASQLLQNDDDYYMKVIKYLLAHGAKIDDVDRQGYTPLKRILHYFLRILRIGEKSVKIFKFLLKHTDLFVTSIVKNDFLTIMKHVSFQKMILEYISKLFSLNLEVNFEILNTISNNLIFQKYLQNCSNELLLAKNQKLKNSWITFFDLLMDSNRKLKNYAGNEDLVKDFKNSRCEEKFPIYGSEMIKRMEKGIQRRKLFDISTEMLSECLPIFNPNHLIIRNALDCLSAKDLSKFCQFVQPNIQQFFQSNIEIFFQNAGPRGKTGELNFSHFIDKLMI